MRALPSFLFLNKQKGVISLDFEEAETVDDFWDPLEDDEFFDEEF